MKKTPARSCRGKKRFSSMRQAQKRADWLNEREVFVKTYQCRVCDGYHLASRSRHTILNQLFDRIARERKRNDSPNNQA